MRRWIGVLALLTALPAVAQTGPTGRLGYLKDGVAWVGAAAQAQAKPLPQSARTVCYTLSPTSGKAWYFVSTGDATARGLQAVTPFASASPLPAPLDQVAVSDLVATGDGRVLYVRQAAGGSVRFQDGRAEAVPYDVASASRDGSVVAFQTDKEIRVRFTATGAEKTIVSIGRPEPLFAALHRAKYPSRIADLVKAIDRDLYREQINWTQGPPALSPDGQKVYFATNAGTGAGAAGNTTWCWMVADVGTGTMLPLSKLGVYYGRVPHFAQVAPVGERLLTLTSLHDNAVVNPCAARVINLLNQTELELLWADRQLRDNQHLTNLTDGACWSPDGRYVAVSVAYYDSEKALRTEDFELEPGAWKIVIHDAATGRLQRTVPGGRQPTWGP